MYHKCIIVVLHNVNTRASDTPQIRRDTTATHVFLELSHELCRYKSDTRASALVSAAVQRTESE